MDKTTLQIVLVVVPVLSLIGSWCALRMVAGRQARRDEQRGEADFR